jgi:hypothetical protein
MTIGQFYDRYSCKLRYDSLQEYFHLYLAIGHPRDVAYRYARAYWQRRLTSEPRASR